MPRPWKHAVTGTVLVLLAGLGTATLTDHPGAAVARSQETAPDERPNIVLVMTDDQNDADLRWMPRTREALQEGGLDLTGAISPHPLCCPARAELVTGQYAQNNGVRHNQGPHGGYDALDPRRTLGEWFRSAGYRTGFVGKYLNKYGPRHGVQPGWDRWAGLTRGTYSYRDFTFEEETGEDRHRDSYVTEVIEAKTNDQVRDLSASGDPFLLMSWHLAPHYRFDDSGRRAPPPPAPQDEGRFERLRPPVLDKPSFARDQVDFRGRVEVRRTERQRSAMTREFRARIRSLQAVDRAVASLVATLEETGEWENTYLFFTSDNGYLLGEHHRVGKNVLLEEALQVPLLVAGPDVPAGSVSDTQVTLVDLPATFAALAGVAPQRVQDGVSLAPLLRDPTGSLGPAADPQPITTTGPVTGSLAGSTALTRDTVLVQTGRTDGDGWDLRGVRTSRYLYATREDGSGAVLHDLAVDPFQLVNHVDDPAYAPVLAELRVRRSALLDCAGPSCNRQFGPEPQPAA